MQVTIPHQLGKAEAKRRLSSRSSELASHLPGMAQVDTRWTGEDRMTLSISAMGQSMTGHIDVQDDCVLFDIALPAALSFIQPIVEGAIRQQGTKLLAPPTA